MQKKRAIDTHSLGAEDGHAMVCTKSKGRCNKANLPECLLCHWRQRDCPQPPLSAVTGSSNHTAAATG